MQYLVDVVLDVGLWVMYVRNKSSCIPYKNCLDIQAVGSCSRVYPQHHRDCRNSQCMAYAEDM